MALLDDILKWTETGLTLWQRDAARRLHLFARRWIGAIDRGDSVLKARSEMIY